MPCPVITCVASVVLSFSAADMVQAQFERFYLEAPEFEADGWSPPGALASGPRTAGLPAERTDLSPGPPTRRLASVDH